jgi:amino acid adenylation domain-containing protein
LPLEESTFVHVNFKKGEVGNVYTRSANSSSPAISKDHTTYRADAVESSASLPRAEADKAQTNVLPRLTLPESIARQAYSNPDALALVAKEQYLTYRELNRRANRLAHYLQTRGVHANTLVGLCVERSLDMVVALLAILKAGGAYVPLDPDYPPERLTFMVEDAQVAMLITQRRFAGQFHLPIDTLVCLDDEELVTQLASSSAADPLFTGTLEDRAYVIYTSGSTGLPKGVQITHGNVLNLIDWHRQSFAVTAADRATQIASPAFDATGWEIWPYLTAGASVHIVDDEVRVAPEQLRDWLLARDISIAFLPTPLAERIIALDWPTSSALRFLLTGGDTLHHYPKSGLPFTLVNNYGPTEATVVATSAIVLPTDDTRVPPPIGRAIDNTRIYILDEGLQPVAAGVTGELYIGGASIAQGYLHRPELTNERFLPDPFSHNAHDRMYRTGDLACTLPDGQIAFAGRIDQQVKLRGFRIELGEIEVTLTHHSAVQQAAVAMVEDDDKDKRLVAYIVPQPDQQISTATLQAYLQEYLPDYMIPSTFVALDILPLTSNGKVDRGALPRPDADNVLRDDELIPPETPTEKRLAAIIEPLLGLQEISIDDNFFMLGGHSLLGTQLIAKISEAFSVDLPLHTLFSAPTIRQLALEIMAALTEKIATMSEEEVQVLLGMDEL